jgi:hypothetical protein
MTREKLLLAVANVASSLIRILAAAQGKLASIRRL